jgi:hypothetical protein
VLPGYEARSQFCEGLSRYRQENASNSIRAVREALLVAFPEDRARTHSDLPATDLLVPSLRSGVAVNQPLLVPSTATPVALIYTVSEPAYPPLYLLWMNTRLMAWYDPERASGPKRPSWVLGDSGVVKLSPQRLLVRCRPTCGKPHVSR